jgi:hypothetical protein
MTSLRAEDLDVYAKVANLQVTESTHTDVVLENIQRLVDWVCENLLI